MARLGVPVGGRVRKLRAVEDQSAPHPPEEITSELGGTIVRQTRACIDGVSPPPFRRKSLNAACFLENVETGPVAHRLAPFLRLEAHLGISPATLS